jgi:hypothetical protein
MFQVKHLKNYMKLKIFGSGSTNHPIPTTIEKK